MMAQGMTIATVKPRSGAGIEYPIVGLLPPETAIEIVREEGDWYWVQCEACEGFVLRYLVVADSQFLPSGFLLDVWEVDSKDADDSRGLEDDLSRAGVVAALTPPIHLQLQSGNHLSAAQKQMVKTWNRIGGLLMCLANDLKFDPGVAVAVLVIEAGGRSFEADGRMVIRFEAHIFHKYWGRQNPDRFNAHFRYNPEKPWKDQQWRPSPDQPWQNFHDISQALEWQVFEFACRLNDTAAKLSISMGGPQIMGFNHTAIGYETVQQMFNAFGMGERNHILGFFDFVKGTRRISDKVIALQSQDFYKFAELYNGLGNRDHYGAKMQGYYDEFQPMWQSLQVRRVATEALNLRRTPGVEEDNIIRAAMPKGTPLILGKASPVMVGSSLWVQVQIEQDIGWVNGAYLDPKVG